MGKRKIFTGLGDEGRTGLLGEGHFNKSDLRFEVLGSLDELSALTGVTKTYISNPGIKEQLGEIQRCFYRVMAEISIIDPQKIKVNGITIEDIEYLDNQIQMMAEPLEMPPGFLLPGDSILTAQIDLTRAVTRRVERRITELYFQGGFGNKTILQFINRLSSYFFVLEIKMLHDEGIVSPTLAKKK